jgi:hypothetical protein
MALRDSGRFEDAAQLASMMADQANDDNEKASLLLCEHACYCDLDWPNQAGCPILPRILRKGGNHKCRKRWGLAVLLASETMQSPILQLSYQQHRIPPLQKTQGRATRQLLLCPQEIYSAATRRWPPAQYRILRVYGWGVASNSTLRASIIRSSKAMEPGAFLANRLKPW